MMFSRVSMILPMMCLLLSACNMPALNLGSKDSSAQTGALTNADQCQARAKSRFALFDRPDTYPVSAEEKKNAYQALYDQCMKEFDVQVASPKPNFEVAASNSTDLANLSPAAGGAPKTPEKQGAITYSNGLMIIDTAQLGKLSPASGKGAAVTSAGGSGSTVVVVQAPPSTAIAYPYSAAAPTGPAAIPVQGKEIVPSAGAPTTAEPKKLITTEANKQHGIPKKSAKAMPAKEVPVVQEKRTVIFAPSRFKKNAEPVAVDLSHQKGDLNALQPAAGSLLDNAVTTNRPPAKD